MPTPIHLDPTALRAFWHRRQGLAAPQTGSPEQVLQRSGWLRTLGGIEVYLALRARVPTADRSWVEGAVARRELLVSPAVRGCIYLVPRADVPLALAVAEAQSRPRTEKDLAKVGVSHAEVEELALGALAALSAGPLGTDALRKAMPAGLVRSLGEVGKKIGMSSALPVALRWLEFEGKIVRSPWEDRLDSERYLWARPTQSPLAGSALPADPTERLGLLATRFFQHAGPASLVMFAEWSGLSQRDAKAALARAPVVPVTVAGEKVEFWMLETDLPELSEGVPSSERVSMLGFEDNLVALHGGARYFVDPRHHGIPVDTWGSGPASTLGAAAHPSERTLFVGDQMVGSWEYDLDAGSVIWGSFDALPPPMRAAIDEAAASVSVLIDSLGHARFVVLDNEASLRARAAKVRALRRG